MTISFDFGQKTSGITTGGIASDYTGVLYSKNVLTGADDIEANYIHLGDTVDKIKGYAKEESSTLGNYYLKHIMTNGQVESSEVCFITDEEHCMKPNDFVNSTTLIQSQQTWFEAQNNGSCSFNSSSSACTSSMLHIDASSYGYVNVYDGSLGCYVGEDDL